VLLLAESAATASEALFPGEHTTWHGFDRYDYEVDGQPVLVVVPLEPVPGRPWVWHGEFFGHRPEPDIALLGRGFHLVHMKIPDQFGAPPAVNHWNAFYQELTDKHGLARKAALIGVSRGGLYCYNWAAANPEKVACIYGDAPVCDLRSWPLGKGKGTGNANETPKLLKVYGVSTIDELLAKAVSPIDQLEPLARAKIPLLHVYGDADTGIPWDENTGVVAERYRKLGGDITLIIKPGVGHVHGLSDSTPIIEFIARHSLAQFRSTPDPIQLGSRRELFVDRFLIDSMRGVINRFKDHPAMGVWNSVDEPEWDKHPVEPLRHAYEIIHELDPDHPVSINHAPRGTVASVRRYNVACDITGADIYPVAYPTGLHGGSVFTNQELSVVGDVTRWMVEVAEGRKPVWIYLQIAWSGVVNEGRTLRYPTFPEQRFMTYQAIIAGARGIIYFGGQIPTALTPEDAQLGWNWQFWRRGCGRRRR